MFGNMPYPTDSTLLISKTAEKLKFFSEYFWKVSEMTKLSISKILKTKFSTTFVIIIFSDAIRSEIEN